MKFSNITDRAFWDAKYAGFRPRYRLLDPFYGRRGLLARALGPHLTGAKTLLELGCGSSRYLMFFNRVAGLETAGIDFSAEGIERLRLMAASHGVVHDLYQGDLFEIDAGGKKFDVVFHSGLVEHFSDLDRLFARCRFFVRDGGQMIFLMPNMQNLAWRWHRRLCPVNHQAHIPYTKAQIARAVKREFRLTLARPWGYPQLYAGGPPETPAAWLLKYLNLGLMLFISGAAFGYRGAVGPRLASTWLFVCQAGGKEGEPWPNP